MPLANRSPNSQQQLSPHPEKSSAHSLLTIRQINELNEEPFRELHERFSGQVRDLKRAFVNTRTSAFVQSLEALAKLIEHVAFIDARPSYFEATLHWDRVLRFMNEVLKSPSAINSKTPQERLRRRILASFGLAKSIEMSDDDVAFGEDARRAAESIFKQEFKSLRFKDLMQEIIARTDKYCPIVIH